MVVLTFLQAEAVMDLIRAKTDKAMGLALNQLDGNLSALIRSLRQEILETLAQVEVNIDYPEYDDVEELTTKLLLEKAQMIQQRIQALLATSKQGKVLREGLSTAIIGRPNVGKSSLLNHLLREEKAIVTDIAGTTRDVIGRVCQCSRRTAQANRYSWNSGNRRCGGTYWGRKKP